MQTLWCMNTLATHTRLAAACLCKAVLFLFLPVLLLWFISQVRTTSATEACCSCILASTCYFTWQSSWQLLLPLHPTPALHWSYQNCWEANLAIKFHTMPCGPKDIYTSCRQSCRKSVSDFPGNFQPELLQGWREAFGNWGDSESIRSLTWHKLLVVMSDSNRYAKAMAD